MKRNGQVLKTDQIILTIRCFKMSSMLLYSISECQFSSYLVAKNGRAVEYSTAF